MLISYALCTHNEVMYAHTLINHLIGYLLKPSTVQYEIVILDDDSTELTLKHAFKLWPENHKEIRVYFKKHNGDFSEQKNALTDLCQGEWIVNLDADEFVIEEWTRFIPMFIETNPDVEAFWVPRMNTVNGMTEEDIKKYRWTITELDGMKLVNWPDYQMRVYRRSPKIRWYNKVHEQLLGYGKFSKFPVDTRFAIRHYKTIERQREQNALYEQIARGK